MFFKENIPLKRRADLELLEETIVVEVSQKNNKKLFFIVSYRHPNISSEEVDTYFSNLNTIIERVNDEKPKAIILTGDFNAKSPIFWENDVDSREGRILTELSISNNLEQLINEPTHIRDDGSQTCIDLLFTDQKYAFTNAQVISHSEHQSKHLIVHGEINFSMPSPPPYRRKIWEYDHANHIKISEDLNKIDWVEIFRHEDVDGMTKENSDLFLDIMSQNIPNKTITCDDKDAPWVTKECKTAIKRNYRVYRKWVKRGRNPDDRHIVRSVQNETNKIIKNAKADYFINLGKKLSNYNTGAKPFWTTFKRLVNKKKQSNIPPIIENGAIISDFRQKSTIFNDYFAMQCTPNITSSTVPITPVYYTESRLHRIYSSEEKVTNIILALNSMKAHGHDDISISMLKICAHAVSKPLNLIYERCLSEGTFPSVWKFADVQLIHKKR